jgi:putative transposase
MGIEDLNVRGMMANEKLARPISDVGFHEIRRQIEYKASIYNAKVVVVDRWYPINSKICSSCNYKLDELPQR